MTYLTATDCAAAAFAATQASRSVAPSASRTANTALNVSPAPVESTACVTGAGMISPVERTRQPSRQGFDNLSGRPGQRGLLEFVRREDRDGVENRLRQRACRCRIEDDLDTIPTGDLDRRKIDVLRHFVVEQEEIGYGNRSGETVDVLCRELSTGMDRDACLARSVTCAP